MSHQQKTNQSQPDVSMTSMVDVVFLLLIFFVVTAAFQLQKSIAMPPATTNTASRQAFEATSIVEIQVGESGEFIVTTDDWTAETPGKQNLIRRLKDANSTSDETDLVIKIHEQAKLQSLVDAMDAGTIAGFETLRITQVDSLN